MWHKITLVYQSQKSELFHENKLGGEKCDNTQPVDIGSRGGSIMRSPFFLPKILITPNHMPSRIYLQVCAIMYKINKSSIYNDTDRRSGYSGKKSITLPQDGSAELLQKKDFKVDSQHIKVEDSSVLLLVVTRTFSSINGTTLVRYPDGTSFPRTCC